MKRLFPIALIIIVLTTFSCQVKLPENHGPIGKNGMVVCAHPEASQIGLEILEAGGNAMDAACAVQFALAVCYPAAGNIGGGGFWVVRKENGEVHTLDYREKAPLSSTTNMYLDPDGEVIRGKSTHSIFASGVPGSVDGMVRAHEKFGKLSWKEVVQPSVDLAEKGFVLTIGEAVSFNRLKKRFMERNPDQELAFVNEGQWQEGDTLIQKDLAEVLKRIRDHKRDGFYGGETAHLIVAEMQKTGGPITMEDLASYESIWREPIHGTYKKYEFYSMAPPSSGGVALSQLLQLVEPWDLKTSGFNTAQTVQYMVEAEKRVYADRTEYLGDPDFVKVPVEQLTDKKYIDKRRQEINPLKATPSEIISHGVWQDQESEETTHYSVTDKWGNAVSATTTLNGGYGNMFVVDGAGFLLNNEMDDFSIKPGYPNEYGLIGGRANAVEPGKRMLSSMTPTIVVKNKRLFMVVGSPGGSTIITSVFQTILNVVEHGMGMQEAVNAPRFHHQWLPDYIQIEKDAFDSQTYDELIKFGQKIRTRSSIGRVDAILAWPDGTYEGGADPRGNDSAKGY